MRIFAKIFILLALPITSLGQEWESVGKGCNSNIRSLHYLQDSSKLIATGGFTYCSDSGVFTCGVATWDGSVWEQIGTGNTFCGGNGFISQRILDIVEYEGQLLGCGSFYGIGGDTITTRIAVWNGSNWMDFTQAKFSNSVGGLIVNDSLLYAFGGFDSIGNISAEGVAVWNGVEWNNLYDLPDYGDNAIMDIAFLNDVIYVAGNFSNFSDPHKEIVCYKDGQWQDVGGGIRGDSWVNDMEVYKNELYVTGWFNQADGNAGDMIMKWNGNNWIDIGGVGAQPRTLYQHNGYLYVAPVVSADTLPSSFIARWDGYQWCVHSTSTFTLNLPQRFLFIDDTLYVGGLFPTINGDTVNSVARYIGSNLFDACGDSLFNVIEIARTNENKLKIYPNPSYGVITIDNANGNAIEVYDQLGYLRYNSIGNIQIDLSFLKTGIYYLKVAEERKMIVIRK